MTTNDLYHSPHRNALRKALKELVDFESWQDPFAVTLTHKLAVPATGGCYRGTPEIYSQNLRHFLNCIERVLIPRAARKRKVHLRTVAALETDQSGRPHYHLMIEKPHHCDEERFRAIITGAWRSSDWGYREIDIQAATSAGWIDYLSKREFVSDVYSIDWHNSHIRGRSGL